MVSIKRVESKDGRNLLAALTKLQDKQAKVGWFPSARYDDAKSTPVASVAAQNEFGNPAKHIPARPFMRPTILNKTQEWKELAEQGAKSVITNRASIEDLLDLIGASASADIKQTISKLTTPALSERTIRARLSRRKNKTHVGLLTKPLVDTSYMLVSLSYEVESIR